MAIEIAEHENADMLIVQLAALLHDVDDAKLSLETYETKKNAVGFMKNNDVDDKAIASVCKIIDEVWVQIRSGIGMLVHLYLQEMKHAFLYLVSSM